MPDTFHLTIVTPEETNSLFSLIRSDLDQEKRLTVTVSDKSESRSSAQRRLMWAWYVQIANFTGVHSAVIRNEMMRRFGVPIFHRDQIQINGISATIAIDSIRDLKTEGLYRHYNAMSEMYVSAITSNSFNVKQNAEYLTDVFNFAASEGIRLFIPKNCKNAKMQKLTRN